MEKLEFESTRFMGRITAGVTHELQNVLAIIKETSGLMDDLTLLCEETPDYIKERYQRSIKAINQQVLRGTNLLSNLNGMAHNSDHATTDIDIYKIIYQLTQLINRYTQSRQIELSIEQPDPPIHLKTHSILFQLAVSHALEYGINSLCPNGSIHIRLENSAPNTVICLNCRGDFQSQHKLNPTTGDTVWNSLKNVLKSLGGEVEINPLENKILLSFLNI